MRTSPTNAAQRSFCHTIEFVAFNACDSLFGLHDSMNDVLRAPSFSSSGIPIDQKKQREMRGKITSDFRIQHA